MTSQRNSIPSGSMDSDMIKELYKKTPLKKRPIQFSPSTSVEKEISPLSEVRSLPEGRISKRKMLKPTKKFINTYVESAAVVEPVQKAVEPMQKAVETVQKAVEPVQKAVVPVHLPAPKTSEEPIASQQDEVANRVAAPTSNSKRSTCELRLFSKSWADLWKGKGNQQDCENISLGLYLRRTEYNLRKRPKGEESFDIRIKFKLQKLLLKDQDAPAETAGRNSTLPEIPKEAKKKKEKKKNKRAPKQTSVKTGNANKRSTCKFTGSPSQSMYILSPELADIVGQEKMSAGAIIDAMHYVFLERNLFEPDKKYVICDDELSEKLFEGKRRLLFDDVKNYLSKHLNPAD